MVIVGMKEWEMQNVLIKVIFFNLKIFCIEKLLFSRENMLTNSKAKTNLVYSVTHLLLKDTGK